MKKFTIIALVVAITAVFAVSAMANEWNLYGSARVLIFFTSRDLKDFGPDAAGRDTPKNTVWNLQNNARVGATVKGDMLSAQFEYGARGARRAPDDFASSTGSTQFANVRRLYGVWNFTEGWGLKVGKDYTPITFFLSAQVFNADDGMLQTGNAYGARQGQIALEGQLGPGQLKFAAINPSRTDFGVILDSPGFTTVESGTENYFPKFEASYQMKFGDNMSAHAFGGFNNSKVYLNVTDALGNTVEDNDTITSWVFGLGGEFNFGPMYIKPQASYYINGANGGWLGATAPSAEAIPQGAVRALGKTVDTNTVMAMLALGFAPTESLSLEMGGGYLYNKSKSELNLDDNSFYQVYLSALWTMAPGVYLAPEIGYYNYGKISFKNNNPDIDLGNLLYFGAKWQIDF
jgi:hypothetical protein